MATERRTSGDRRTPTTVSVRRLEGKVDLLAQEVEKDRHATTELGQRVDRLNLNGSAAALHRLAANSDKLLKLAETADYIIAAIDHRKEQEIISRWLRRILNPFASKFGALLWLLFSAVVFAYIANLIR